MSSIVPSIGRKVWYWQAGGMGLLDTLQPFDATVIFIHDATTVNLRVTDHQGGAHIASRIPLRDATDASIVGNSPDCHGVSNYATWMPYQMGQAMKDRAGDGRKEPSAA